jgi:hypothetical protein
MNGNNESPTSSNNTDTDDSPSSPVTRKRVRDTNWRQREDALTADDMLFLKEDRELLYIFCAQGDSIPPRSKERLHFCSVAFT